MQQEVNKRIPVSLLIHRNNILLKEMYSSEKKGGKEGEGFRRLYKGVCGRRREKMVVHFGFYSKTLELVEALGVCLT